jgi:hypothetical protein
MGRLGTVAVVGVGFVAIWSNTSVAQPVAGDAGPDASNDSGLSSHCAQLANLLAIAPGDARFQRGNCDDKVCASAGGACAYAGFCFGQACVKKTHDGGWSCTDAAQCEGKACLAREGTPAGPGVGGCTTTLITLGCHRHVSGGVVSRGALCGD